MISGRGCLEPGCPALAVDGQRCGPHRRRHEAPYRDPRYKTFRQYVRAGMFGPCVDCGSWNELQVDHIVPLAAGGANREANWAVRCRVCNRRKWAGGAREAR